MDSIKYPINEIFYSIQGEGHHAGRAAVFIRLSGCNRSCSWCDTDHSKKKEMTASEIVIEVLEKIKVQSDDIYNCMVVLTGGEPTIHSLLDLLWYIKTGYPRIFIAIETNGYDSLALQMYKEHKLIDWITFSPKTEYTPKDRHNKYVCDIADEVKIVFENDIVPFSYISVLKDKFEKRLAYIQPCSENFEPAIEYVQKNPYWNLSVQLQKILKVR